MKRVPTGEVKKRSRKLTSLFESFSPYQDLEGSVVRVWVTDVAADGIHLVCRSLQECSGLNFYISNQWLLLHLYFFNFW